MGTATEIELDAVFAALGNRTRRSLITRLGEGDATVSELAAPYDMTLPAVSKHLLVLENAGLITRTRDGKSRRCALSKPALEQAESWLTDRRKHWTDSLDSLAAYLESDESSA